jgi:hypothetical protein
VAVAARSDRLARTRGFALARVSPLQWLGAIVAVSFVVRTIAGWLRAGPVYFPDEYIYSELGRSIGEHGRPLVRGAAAHFPAVLQPLLTAPAWLADDVETAFRLVQLEGALVMSLAAVPVYLLARKLELGAGLALGAAALSVAVPDMLYAGWVLADPFTYPLALAALAAGVTALAYPSRRSQIAFVAFAGLATLARVQFVVLPACFLLAALGLGLRERRVRRVVVEQRLAFGLFALALVPLVLAGPGALLGYYHGVLDLHLSPLGIGKWAAADAMLVLYSCGWILAPGAIVGLVLAVWRPRSRAELAFGILATLFSLAVLFQAGLYAANGADRIQERYFCYLLPLVFLAFGLFASRGWPHRVPHALLAGALILVSARVPLAGFAASDGRSNSPLLFSAGELENLIGDTGLASLAIAGLVALLSLAAAALGFRPRRATGIAVGLALGACALSSAGAVAYDHALSTRVRANVVPGNPSMVDAAGLGDAALLQSPHGDRGFATEELFWNRSLTSLVLLPGAPPTDAFAVRRAQIGGDGSILVAGKGVEQPLLVDSYGATTRFRGARELDRTRLYRLLEPMGRPRLALYVPGRYFDGWLALEANIRLWPAEVGGRLAGTLGFSLYLPANADPVEVRLRYPSGERTVAVQPGTTSAVSLRVCSTGPWSAHFSGPFTGNIGPRFVSVRSTEPVFRPNAAACS